MSKGAAGREGQVAAELRLDKKQLQAGSQPGFEHHTCTVKNKVAKQRTKGVGKTRWGRLTMVRVSRIALCLVQKGLDPLDFQPGLSSLFFDVIEVLISQRVEYDLLDGQLLRQGRDVERLGHDAKRGWRCQSPCVSTVSLSIRKALRKAAKACTGSCMHGGARTSCTFEDVGGRM